jgi:hypothetical protein
VFEWQVGQKEPVNLRGQLVRAIKGDEVSLRFCSLDGKALALRLVD